MITEKLELRILPLGDNLISKTGEAGILEILEIKFFLCLNNPLGDLKFMVDL